MSILDDYLANLIRQSPLWERDSVVIAACSGGADSLALTHALSRVGEEDNVEVKVVHVNHNLRGEEAKRDADSVEDFCDELGLMCTVVDVDVKALVEAEGLSTEEAARRLRYEALEAERDRCGAVAVFLGQHLDDQAETVLLNLLRGAGTRGLRGMQEVNGYLARPFLSITKADLIGYCREHDLEYVTDSSNTDTTFTRNWVRLEVLPLLERKNPQIKKQLAQGAILAGLDESYLNEQAELYLRAYGTSLGDFYDTEVADGFAKLALAIKTRVLRNMLMAVGAKEVSFEHIQKLIKLIEKGEDNKAMDVPGKVRAIYVNGRLTVGKNRISRAEERAAKNLQKETQRNANAGNH